MQLRVYNSLTKKDFSALMEVYAEGNRENAEYFYPELPCEEGIKLAEEDFRKFLDKFFSVSGNKYYILEDNGIFISALRLRDNKDFYYLEGLETSFAYRKNGYAVMLINEVCKYLMLRDLKDVVIRDCVSKNNHASLAAHRKAGFIIESEQGIDYEDGSQPPNHYGMLLVKKYASVHAG